MKKLILLVLFLLSFGPLEAEEESFLIINPGRETFIHFPSTTLNNRYTITFFLPEPRVPLKRNYPVVVMLGATPQQAQQVADFQQKNKAIIVGINFEEKDYEQYADKIVQFLSRELLPYVDTNYWTQTGPENRILAAAGKNAARVALRVVQNPQLYGGLFLLSPADIWEEKIFPPVRTLVMGTQSELALTQQVFEQAGKVYGPDFALRYTPEGGNLFDLNTEYLWAPADELQLTKLEAEVSARKISLNSLQTSTLRVWAILKNGDFFHYVPSRLRFSPPYLDWNPFSGVLRAVAGATTGTVRVRNGVDKPSFSVKIKLKK